MSESPITLTKTAKPEGLENKALTPAVEDKALTAETAPAAEVKFTLAHYVTINGAEHSPGDVLTIPADRARQLAESGLGS